MNEESVAPTEETPLASPIRDIGVATAPVLIALIVAIASFTQLGPVFDFSTMFPLISGLLAIGMLVADLISFRVRTGVTRSSLYLAGLTVAMLTLPAANALFAVIVALTLSAVLRQVRLWKALYFASCNFLASASMITVYRLLTDNAQVKFNGDDPLTTPVIIAIFASSLVYASVYFFLIGAQKTLILDQRFTKFTKDNFLPFFGVALASVLVGTLIVAILVAAPILLPVAILPAWAIVRTSKDFFASREALDLEDRVSEVSKILASNTNPEELVNSFLTLTRNANDADVAVAVRLNGSSEVIAATVDGLTTTELTPELRELTESILKRGKPTSVNRADLPDPYRASFAAPLQVNGVFNGVVALGFSDRRKAALVNVPLWSSLVGSLSSALEQSALFARVEAITASQFEGIVSLSRDGSVSFFNPAATEFIALNEDSLGKNVEAWIKTPSQVLKFEDLLKLDLSSTVFMPDAILSSPDFPDLAVSCTVTRLNTSSELTTTPSDVKDGIVVAIRDLTAEKSAAVAMAKSQEQIIALGRALQASLLPPALPTLPGVEIDARYHAAAGGLDIGGDFYDVLNTRDGCFNIIMGDVCGRGPEAAALTALTRHTLRGAVGTDPSPAKALGQLNTAVYLSGDETFCTVAMGRMSAPVDGKATLRVTLGGHPPVLIIRKDGRVEEVDPAGELIGIFEEVQLEEIEVEMFTGDAAVFYTDGVLEARGPDGAFFEDAGMHQLLSSHAGEPASSITGALDEAVKNFQGGVLQDDTAFLVVSVK